jgi:hypothetical protein
MLRWAEFSSLYSPFYALEMWRTVSHTFSIIRTTNFANRAWSGFPKIAKLPFWVWLRAALRLMRTALDFKFRIWICFLHKSCRSSR